MSDAARGPVGDPLLRWRDAFPILSRSTYLVSKSLGAMPRTVPGDLARYTEAWETLGVQAWAREWWELPVKMGDEIAPLIGAAAGEVAMVTNVTIGHAALVSALSYAAPRDTIVMTALDFPSVRYAVEGLAARFGARVVVVPSDDGVSIDHDRLCAAIDERTRLVAISHVLFRSAHIMDAARICAHATRMGALVALDAYHSVGVMPVDVRAIGCDFYVGGVLKWLCGGPGGAFLWVSPETSAAVAPAFTGWQAHARPFAFEGEMAYADGAWRWLSGTPAIAQLYAGAAGPRIVREAGVAAIRAKSTRQTRRLIELADARGFAVSAPRDDARRGGTVAFDVPHGYEVAQELLARHVIVDYRPGAGIRVAPHFYTSDDELEVAVAMIDEILASGAWQQHAGRRAIVT